MNSDRSGFITFLRPTSSHQTLNSPRRFLRLLDEAERWYAVQIFPTSSHQPIISPRHFMRLSEDLEESGQEVRSSCSQIQTESPTVLTTALLWVTGRNRDLEHSQFSQEVDSLGAGVKHFLLSVDCCWLLLTQLWTEMTGKGNYKCDIEPLRRHYPRIY